MNQITQDFLQNRESFRRVRKFIAPSIIILVVAGSAVAGFFLYEKYQKPKPLTAENSGKLPKDWLLLHFGTTDENSELVGGPEGDPDGDILTNEQEFFFGTDPVNADSDADGQGDGAEVAFNANPLGEGELYSTQRVKDLVDKYLESGKLEEFKKENIEKQVLGILNPPDPATVELKLPDIKTLKISSDNGSASVETYLQKATDAVGELNFSEETINQIFEDPSAAAGIFSSAAVYDAINKLRAVAVPNDFIYFHQLHITVLFATAAILDVQKGIDPNADPTFVQDKIQEQYYQIAVTQKAEQELAKETEKLKAKYPEETKKYAITADN